MRVILDVKNLRLAVDEGTPGCYRLYVQEKDDFKFLFYRQIRCISPKGDNQELFELFVELEKLAKDT